MSLQSPLSIAKITRPRLSEVIPRQRLIDALTAADANLVWIGGAPGYGKTTLAASVVDAVALPCLWLNIDAADLDPANYFHHLSEAARPLLAVETQLPVLVMEQLGSIDLYAREYFRALFQGLGQRFVLVHDDMHTLPVDSAVVRLLPVLLEESAHSARIIITSRETLPASLIRYQANARVYILDPNELLFSETETAQLLTHWQLPADKDHTAALHRLTRGWAGGMTLVRTAIEKNDPATTAIPSLAPTLREYFRSEILDSLSPQDRQRLARLAWLAVITAESCSMLADADTFDLVARMAKMAQFVFAHTGEPMAYSFHPLFAEFLRECASTDPDTDTQALVLQSAAALHATGDAEAAIDLWLACSAYESAAPCIEKIARRLFAEARLRTLMGWIKTLPEEYRTPWLGYWWAVCHWLNDPQKGRELMTVACHRFKAIDDQQGMYLALSYLIGSYFFTSTGAEQLHDWLDEIALLEVDFEQIPDQTMQANIAFSVWYGLFMTRPGHPDLPLWESRLQRLLRAAIDPTAKIRVGMILSLHYCFNGQYSKIWPLRGLLSTELSNARLSHYGHLAWYLYSLQDHWSRGDFAAARGELDEALALSAESGCHLLDHHLVLHTVTSMLLDSATDEASRWLHRVSDNAHAIRNMEIWHLYLLKAWHACLCQRQAEAVGYADICWQTARDMGGVAPQCFALLAKCYIYILNKDLSRAEHSLSELRSLPLSIGNELWQFHTALIDACLALSRGQHRAAEAAVSRAFAIGRQQGLFHFVLAVPRLLLPLCQLALEQGIETEFAIELARQRRLFSPDVPLHLEQWPWPVKIYTLGGFTILLDGQPLAQLSKAQRRTLELLKAVVSMGGHKVSVSLLCDALWPDAEADAAHHAFETGLYRLRKLIGKQTLVLHDARLSLAKERCWVDAWALESILRQKVPEHIRAQRVRAIYRGPFLFDEPDASWAIERREQLRREVERLLSTA